MLTILKIELLRYGALSEIKNLLHYFTIQFKVMKSIFKSYRTKNYLVLAILFVLLVPTGEAQIFKKLTKKVGDAVERTVINKTSDKAAQEASKKMDKILNAKLKKSKVDPTTLPESYDFEWKYAMEMTTKDYSYLMNYYLKPDTKYFGALPDAKQSSPGDHMFMVMDIERSINTIFMDTEGGKMAQIMDVNFDDYEDESQNDTSEYTIEEIDSKVILGYQCQGFKMTNKEIEMIMYITNEAPVSFSQIYGMDESNLPKGFNSKWLKYGENGCVMEVDFRNKRKKKHSMKMVCVAMEKEERSIVPSDYTFMGNKAPTFEE